MYGKREKRVTRGGARLSFCVTNGKREKKESLAASAGLSIPGICGQRTMTNEGAKTKGPACTAGTA